MLARAASALLGASLLVALAACGRMSDTRATDITGVMPPLAFHMVRVNDGADVDAESYRGKAVILYFGYTHCPDQCPATLANLATALQKLGTKAKDVRVLFVSVDPDRDTPAILRTYVQAFAPEIDGLRGNADEIARLARRYRVLYAVTPAFASRPYEVAHSASVFFFDAQGHARFVTMDTGDAAAVARMMDRLLA